MPTTARRGARLGSVRSPTWPEATLDATRPVVETSARRPLFLDAAAAAAARSRNAIDISHESLIRGWRRCGLGRGRGGSRRNLSAARRDGRARRRRQSGLWRDPDLAVALAWRERERPSAAWASRYHLGWDAATRFLDDSRAAREAAARAEAEARRAAIRRSRIVIAVSVVGALVFAALALVGYYEAQSANEQRLLADQATTAANARRREAVAALQQAETRARPR